MIRVFASRRPLVTTLLALSLVFAFSGVMADTTSQQDDSNFIPTPTQKAEEKKPTPGGKPGGPGKPDKKSKIKPYKEVVTKKAISDSGLFNTHRVGDKLYFEIPLEAMGQDMVWVTQVAQTTAGSSLAGMPAGNRVVRWEKKGNRVLLRDVRFGIRADTEDSIAMAVKASNLAPIIKAFDVVAYAPLPGSEEESEEGKEAKDKKKGKGKKKDADKDKSDKDKNGDKEDGEEDDKKADEEVDDEVKYAGRAPVIDVTNLFTKDVPEFSARRALGSGRMDSDRSFVEESKAFPINIETRVMASYAEGTGSRRPGAPRLPGANIPRSSGITAMIHHSMVKLPERPMRPRRFDDRVGFFSLGFTDFADDSKHEAEPVRYITRWRLEKKNPGAKMSEPVKPIVFYVSRETPDKWKKYVKAGIEDWRPAFEAAGFKNAILGKYPPSEEEDPDWDPEDARISSIRWLASPIENAFGPHVHDPRTGEIIEADVRMFHNVQKLVRDWYFVQAAAVDKRAQDLPMPDDLVGELIRFVVAHEVGHSLGFPHNMKASSTYSVAQLRDPNWTKKNGTAPSIMDYARFNYVAQPGDGAGLMPAVGPYDLFSTEWGYREFANDEAERKGLADIVARQVSEPMFRFGNPNPFVDSTQQTEDLGSDAVAATEMGLQNLKRIADMLVPATSETGEDYRLLANMYIELLGQWAREMGHVANVVGGVQSINLRYGDAERVYFPNEGEYQRRAVKFMLEHAFSTPDMFLQEDIVNRLTAQGVAPRLSATQRRLLMILVNGGRIDRMAEQVARGNDYAPVDFLGDLRAGLFNDLGSSPDLYRRNIHRAYVDQLGRFLVSPSSVSDAAALARYELESIKGMADPAKHSGADAMSVAHMNDLRARIDMALDPEGTGIGMRIRAFSEYDAFLDSVFSVPEDGCWPGLHGDPWLSHEEYNSVDGPATMYNGRSHSGHSHHGESHDH